MFFRLTAAEVDKKLEMRESLLKWSAIFHVVHGAVRLGKKPIEKNPSYGNLGLFDSYLTFNVGLIGELGELRGLPIKAMLGYTDS